MPGRPYRPSTYTAEAVNTSLGSRRFPPAASNPGQARAWVRDVLPPGVAVDADGVALLVSELTTNAVVHAKTTFSVAVTMTDTAVRVEVSDSSDIAPERTAYGMGLRVTDDVASTWGWHPTRTGKTVWFEVPRLA